MDIYIYMDIYIDIYIGSYIGSHIGSYIGSYGLPWGSLGQPFKEGFWMLKMRGTGRHGGGAPLYLFAYYPSPPPGRHIGIHIGIHIEIYIGFL